MLLPKVECLSGRLEMSAVLVLFTSCLRRVGQFLRMLLPYPLIGVVLHPFRRDSAM